MMAGTGQQNRMLFGLIAFLALALIGVAGWFFLFSEETSRHRALVTGEGDDPSQSDGSKSQLSPAQTFQNRLENTSLAADRVKLLKTIPDSGWAKSDWALLRELQLNDSSEEVRQAAFEVSLTLAERENHGAVVNVLTTAIDNPHADVKRESLRQCRGRADSSMVPKLIEIAKSNTGERYLAIDALAFIDDRAAQEKVLEAAMNKDLPPNERARAIALLSRSTLPQACEYLKELVEGDDPAMRKLALSTLAAMQGNQPKPK